MACASALNPSTAGSKPFTVNHLSSVSLALVGSMAAKYATADARESRGILLPYRDSESTMVAVGLVVVAPLRHIFGTAAVTVELLDDRSMRTSSVTPSTSAFSIKSFRITALG